MTGRRAVTLLFLATVAARASADDGLRPGETVRETDAVFPGAVPDDEDGLPTLWPVRIVDAWTGKPIAGATVRVPNHNSGGSAPEDIYDLCSGTADRDGWVRLPWKDAMGWRDYIVADAPGYAPNEHCDLGASSCGLTPGTDVPVQLLDFTGRAVAGARIALNLGCGHIADQRDALTDASGRAVFRSIDPRKAHGNGSCIWLESPALHRGTAIMSTAWRPGDPPVPVYGPPGVVVAGRVLGQDGKPVKDAVVGAHDQERPWMRTGEDGRFRLVGVEPWSQVDVYPKYGSDEPMVWFFTPPEGVERTFTLGAADAGVPLTVTLRGPAGEPADGARIVLVRPTDGLTAPRFSDAAGAGEFSLPPGRYDVLVDGAFGKWGAARGAVELKEGAPATLTLAVPRRSTVRVDASRVKDLKLKQCRARGWRDVDPAEIDGRDVPVPADERSVFFVWGHEDRELLVNIVEMPQQASDPAKPLVLDWVPATRVTARFAGPDGEAVAGSLRVARERGGLDWGSDSRKIAWTRTQTVETHLRGTLDWTAQAEDPGLAMSFGTIRIDEPGKPVDLGEIRFAAVKGPTFRIEVPEGTTTEGVMATVRLRRENFLWTGIIEEDGSLGVDLSWVGPGEVVTVSLPGNLATRQFRVEGSPPWLVTWPDTSLAVHVLDEAGAEIEGAAVLFDDPADSYETGEAGTLLLGVPEGKHEVVVAAEGHRAKIVTLTLKEGDPREIRVKLAARE